MYADTSIRLQAHKGDSVHAPENTMAAFRLACDEGYEFIELDPKIHRRRGLRAGPRLDGEPHGADKERRGSAF